MTKAVKRAAIYTRVSTDSQTIENQLRELPQVAERRGWEVVEVYNDAGISGAKVRASSPCGESSTDLHFLLSPSGDRDAARLGLQGRRRRCRYWITSLVIPARLGVAGETPPRS